MIKQLSLRIFFLLTVCCFITNCRHRHYRDQDADDNGVVSSRTDNDEYKESRRIRRGTKVKMISNGGVYFVPITVNGLDLKFIFDTGASSICISSAEATVMVRQGLITRDDILGQEQFQDATGGVSIGTVINLKTVEIGGIVLHDIEATVVDNIEAPLLLGQTALAKFGKISIDYDNLTIEFN